MTRVEQPLKMNKHYYPRGLFFFLKTICARVISYMFFFSVDVKYNEQLEFCIIMY